MRGGREGEREGEREIGRERRRERWRDGVMRERERDERGIDGDRVKWREGERER